MSDDLSQYEGTGLKAEDLIPAPAAELRKEKLDQERRLREQATLEEQIVRIQKILDNEQRPGPTLLGIRLALEMAVEIRDQKGLGTSSAVLLRDWNVKYPHSSIEESVAVARTLLTKPAEMASAIRQKLFDGRS